MIGKARAERAGTNRRLMLTIILFTAMIAASHGQASDDFDAAKARGSVVASLTCLADSKQSYALYLPSKYFPDRSWPIIYAFDPFARGKVPVELYKEAAEKYGYIVVGSNNAKNGPGALEMEAAQAVWQDTHRRFLIDRDRVYTTGLSGGARFATSFALYCYTCAIAGVIAQGAGYPVKESLPANDHFLYYVAVGDADFNLPEILKLRKQKEANKSPFKVKIYPGPHQWAPRDVVEDAIEWLELKAMQAGLKKPDLVFIHPLFDRTRAEATQAEQRGDTMAQFYALRSLALDFKGLEDVAGFESALAALRISKSLKRAAQDERRAIEKQESLTAAAAVEISRLGAAGPEEQVALRQHLLATFADLRRYTKSNDSDRLVFVRALNQLWVQGIEDGQQEFRNNQMVTAAAYFELMADVAPDQSWPELLLAESRARAGNKKAALKALEEAVKRGLKSPETLTQDPELQSLLSEPAFQRIVQGLGGAAGNK